MDLWKKLIPKQNSPEQTEDSERVRGLQKKLRLQAMTVLASVALVLVLVFAMTAAWYTNVAKTSDLTFQTEVWGFDGEITVADEEQPILALPGSSGFVPLTVDNSESTQGVEIGVTIAGVFTDESNLDRQRELQKRIYFYVDTPQTYTFGTGETAVQEKVSRVYLGASETDNYVYTVLPGQKLTLTESYYNDTPIKWMWVYDMLGYYFRGKVTTSEASEDEFLRPIEYDYQSAVFDDGEKSPTIGQILEADGLELEDFLLKISKADGYEGEIDPNSAVTIDSSDDGPSRIFYPIEVDSDGYGVWAYLCNQDEIKEGIQWDNELAELTAQDGALSMTATMKLTAVNVPTAETEVVNASGLNEALADPDVDVVALTQDLYLDDALSLAGDTSKVLNLNGWTLDYSGTDDSANMFAVNGGASLTVMGGSVHNSEAQGDVEVAAFAATGSNVTLSNVTVTGFDTAVDVTDKVDNAEDAADSTIRIIGCTFDTRESAVELRGNGSATEATTKVVIEDSTITSGYIGVSGLGASDNWGTELVLLNSTIEGYYSALYQPQQRSTTTITGCTLSGITGIAVKGGTVTIYDSTITGTGPYADAKNESSGFTDTGDGVYVEAGYDWSVSVVLKGSDNEIVSQNAYAVELYSVEGKGPGKILIHGGTFTGAADKGSARWNGIGTFEIYGGEYPGALIAPDDYPIVRYDLEE